MFALEYGVSFIAFTVLTDILMEPRMEATAMTQEDDRRAGAGVQVEQDFAA